MGVSILYSVYLSTIFYHNVNTFLFFLYLRFMAQAPDDVEYEERQEDKPAYNVTNPKASYIQIGDGSEIHHQRISQSISIGE